MFSVLLLLAASWKVLKGHGEATDDQTEGV